MGSVIDLNVIAQFLASRYEELESAGFEQLDDWKYWYRASAQLSEIVRKCRVEVFVTDFSFGLTVMVTGVVIVRPYRLAAPVAIYHFNAYRDGDDIVVELHRYGFAGDGLMRRFKAPRSS